MTLLTQPVAVDHPEDWGPDFARCGADNANAVVSIVLPNSTFAVPDGADAQQMQDAIASACPGAQIMTLNSNAADLVAQYVQQGWYVLAQVYCDSQANPVPNGPADHWITVYGDTDPAPWFQCWTNSYLTMTLAYLRSVSHQNDIHYHVLVKLPGASQAANVQSNSGTQVSEADDMVDTGRQIEVQRGGGRLDSYKLDTAGDVWHYWPNPDGSPGGSERIGQNGSPNQGTGLVPPQQQGTITGGYNPATGVTTLEGTAAADGRLWRARQTDGGGTWVCDLS